MATYGFSNDTLKRTQLITKTTQFKDGQPRKLYNTTTLTFFAPEFTSNELMSKVVK